MKKIYFLGKKNAQVWAVTLTTYFRPPGVNIFCQNQIDLNMFLFLQYNLTKAKHMQTILENVNVVQHTKKIYTMYGILNGHLNYLG